MTLTYNAEGRPLCRKCGVRACTPSKARTGHYICARCFHLMPYVKAWHTKRTYLGINAARCCSYRTCKRLEETRF